MSKDFCSKKNSAAVLWNNRMFGFIILFFIYLFSSSACVSHLKKAKFHYAQGQEYSRHYHTEKSISSYKRALEEAEIVVSKHPSSQGYMLKGMAELNLEFWKEAEESFRNAHSYGFEKGEEWAQQLSLLGLASSLEALGLESPSFRIYGYLLDKSKLKPVTIVAAQRYTDAMLRKALHLDGKEKKKQLSSALKEVQKLSDKDLSCGFYHYLQSQVYSHLADYRKSFEGALMGKELGLPTEEILRDNDLQIIFCYKNLKEELSSGEWDEFRARYSEWIKKWKWKGPETPDWKEER